MNGDVTFIPLTCWTTDGEVKKGKLNGKIKSRQMIVCLPLILLPRILETISFINEHNQN